MNVTQLKAQLDQALEAGLHPQTEVVLDLQDIPGIGWYICLNDEAEHPLDGKERVDLWFTLSPALKEGVHDDIPDNLLHADPRFTPAHYAVPDPVLFAQYEADRAMYGDATGSYDQWLLERYEGLAGALRDDPPRPGNHSELAGIYSALAAYLHELERMS